VKEGNIMAITLNLPPEVEASLAAQAKALGLQLNSYVQTLLEQQAGMGRGEQTINLEQFEAELDALAQGSDKLPYLPPAALTRESFYQDHD
jgi:hypothetical protein